MKFKREIIIISLIIAMLFTVSSVCAVDSGIQATGAQNSTFEVVSAANDNDDLGMNDAGEILADGEDGTDTGTFTQLWDNINSGSLASGSTVYLEKDFVYSNGDTTTSGIAVSKDLTIDGQGHKIDAKGKSRMFSISAGYNVVFKNIVFINGKAPYGGAISTSTSTQDKNKPVSVEIINCTFENNSVSSSSGSNGHAGAVYLNVRDHAYIINSTFIGNKAYEGNGQKYGGAAYINVATAANNCQVINSTFINNYAYYNGGALYISSKSGIDEIVDYCTFINNTGIASSVIYGAGSGKIIVNNSVLVNNGEKLFALSTTTLSSLENNWWGNTEDNFDTNISKIGQSGRYITSWLFLKLDTNDETGIATISLNNLYSNGVTSSYNGKLPKIKLNIINTNVDVDKNVVVLDDEGKATFHYDFNSDVGSLTVSYEDISITKTFKELSFTSLRNKINTAVESTICLTEDFTYNDTKDNGLTEGIDFAKSITIDGQGHTIDAKNLKRIFYINDDSKDIVLKNINFVNGNAEMGGAIYAISKSLTLVNCTFINDTATSKGGAIYLQDTQSSEIINCTFINGSAAHGSDIFMGSVDAGNVEGCIFTNNTDNSVIYCMGQGNYNIHDSILIKSQGMAVDGDNTANINANYNWWGNTADNYDTSIVDVGSSVTRTNWLFLDMVNDDKARLSEISLNNLYSIGDGNNTYSDYALPEITLNISSSNSRVSKNNVTIVNIGKNSIKYIVKTEGSITVSFNGIELTRDISYDDVGNFYSLYYLIANLAEDGDTIELKGNYNYDSSTDSALVNQMWIQKNIVIDGKGHSIDARGQTNIFKVYNANVTFKNIIFLNGFSTTDGGAIYYAYSGVNSEVINCTFINNVASGYGGAIYSYSSGLNKITNSTFINNSAIDGATAIYTPTSIDISNSIFVGNNGGNIIDGPGAVTANNNWWGHTVEDYTNSLNLGSSVTTTNWYVLNMSVDGSTIASITLNNLYDGNDIIIDNNYALPTITFNTQSSNTQLSRDNVTLDNSGKGNIEHSFSKRYSITANYNGVEITRDYVSKAPFTELKSQINEITGDTLYLDQNYVYNSTVDNLLSRGIDFSKTLIIEGDGFTIDAKGFSNIFYFDDVTNTKNLILKNITFANAKGENGTAVYFNGKNIQIINCTFINNTASGQGAVVYVNGASNNVENKIIQSTFINNTCDNSIIYLNSAFSDASFEVTDSIIVNNNGVNIAKGTGVVNANYDWWGNNATNYNINIANVGEGISVEKWYYLNMTVDDEIKCAEISLNNLNDQSSHDYILPQVILDISTVGAIANEDNIILDSTGKATVDYSLTSLNGLLTASYNSVEMTSEVKFFDTGDFNSLQNILNHIPEGSMYNLTRNYTYSESDTITDGILIDKRIAVNGNGCTIDAKGKSRIFNLAAEGIYLKNINFINGKSDSGGAIYFAVEYINIDNCSFINNTASSSGGAICSYADKYRWYVTNSKFIDNSAGLTSGASAIFNYADYGVVDKCIFINNTGKYTIFQYSHDNISNSIFLNNNPNTYIYNYYGGFENNWIGNTFDNYNTPLVSGHAYKWLYLKIKFYEDYAIISLNNLYTKSSSSSSIISDNGLPDITLKINSTTLNLNGIENIKLDSNGTAKVPYSMRGDEGALTVSYGDFSYTKERVVSEFDSLQILINEHTGTTPLILQKNYTYAVGADEIIEGIVINKNITIDGGGHTIDAKEMSRIFNVQALNVTFKNIIFANGKSNLDGQSYKPNDGGAIYYNVENTEKIEFNVINCTFINNTAIKDIYTSFCYSGAAIYVKANNGTFYIGDSSFIKNTANNMSGAIYFNAKDSEFNLYNSSFIGNKAVNNGALYIETDNTVIAIDRCLFRYNTATSTEYSANGNAIIWNTTNDKGNNVIKNSIIIDNTYNILQDTYDNSHTFLLISGIVNIDNNWWGTTAQNHPDTFGTSFVYGRDAPHTWLFINSEVSDDKLGYNQTSTIKYFLQAHDGENVNEIDNTKLPDVAFDVTCNYTLNKNIVALNEEFTTTANDTGTIEIDIYCNNLMYQIFIDGPYIAPKVDVPYILYANQGVSKNLLIKTDDGLYNDVVITCNDSSLINLPGSPDIQASSYNVGTAKITFSRPGISGYSSDSYDLIVNVVKVPLNITVINIESNDIILNVSDTLHFDIAFEIDAIHKEYAPAWNVLGVKYDSSIISFNYDDGVKPTNGSYYTTGHIKAKFGGTTNLTIYSTSDKFKWENYTIKITVNKIPTEINLGNEDSFKVDDTSNVNAVFLNNGTQSTTTLTFESSDEDVIKFTSNTGDFKAVGNGTAVLTVTFSGNSTHEASSKTITVTVSKYTTTTSVTSDKTLDLKVGDDSQILATLTAEDGAELTISYESSDENVATVDSTGKITAVGEGTAMITAKYDGTYKYETSSDTVTVTVTKIATTIDLTSSGEVPLNVFEYSQIEATLDPSVVGSLTYASSNETVVTVDSDGKITAHAGGKANITISFDGDYKYAAAEDVIVSVNVNKLPTTITVNPEISVDVDDTNTIVASADHGRALKYESLNSDVVTVNETTGVITGVNGGTGVINISFAEDGQYLAESTTVTVTVNKLTSSITVNPIEINVFDSQLIDPTVVSDGVVSYVSCDPVIVTVNATNGNITGVKGGKANVTIYVAESDRYLAKEVNVTVTVKKLPTEITVDPTITVDVDGTNTIDASADHGRALKYESLNPDLVTVDENTGVITGVAGGTGVINVSFAEDGQYLAESTTVTVTVNKLTPEIAFGLNEVDVFETKQINATVLSGDGIVTYVSCNPSIVTVDENTGEITGVIGDVANVTIKMAETPRYSSKEANITVKVNKIPTVITVSPTMRLKMGDNETIVATVVSGADIHYHSDSELITVDDAGLVTAIKGGVAEVTVSVDATDKYLANSTTVTVTVARLPDDDTPIELSVFSKADVSALYDFGSDPNNLKYNSSNITVFTVNETGMLEAKAGGEANLTISDEILGESVTIKVIVNKLDTIIAVNPTIDVKVYESKSLGAIVNSGRALIYESLNSDVVTVNETTGVITGVIGGTGVINISFAEDGQYKANSTLVTVTVNKLHSTIDINESEFSIFVDGTAAINATTNNEGGLLYASTSPFISLANNIVTGVSQGVAEIKVIALENDKYLAKTEVVNVTVNRIPSTITVGGNNFTIDVDGSVDIGATLNHDGILTYKYNESIIAVENGLITGIIGGKTNITISYAGDNKYMPAEDVNVSVTVNKLPTTITVNSTISVDVDGTNVIEASADGRTLEFISCNETIVTVDDAGVITGVIGGVANVTVKFSENDRYLGDEVNVTVTVNKLTSTIAVNPIEIDVFDSQLINPEIVSDGVVSYVSCNTSIVTVNANGNVTGVKGGKANVTIKVAESDRYLPNEVNVTVTVNKLPTAITVNPAISIDYGKTKTIDASADNGGKLIYTSLNSDIVTVDENGLITAVKSGEATVNIKFEENETHTGNEVNVTVTVNRLPISIAITDANDVFVGGTSTIQLTINETDATGFVIVNVNGTEYPINISQTKSLSVVLDNVGDYDVYATYQGDDKYQTAESNPETVKAYPKLENSLEVNVTQNIITGQKVEINATSSSGIIDVYVDGVKQTVIDGKAVIDSLSPGTHTIQVISNETSQYVANSTEFTVDVAKKQATISIEIVPKDLVVGTYFNIEIVYDGPEPVVYMDGAVLDEYENIKAIAGTHLIVATINDNEEYVGTTETYNFTVSKIKPSEIYVSGTTVTVGEKTTIEVSDLPKDATGIVIINLNGTKYSMNITEGKSLEIVLDNVGSYKLSAQYLGDDKYLPSDESIGNSILSRDKKTNSIDIKYPSEISAGDNVTITVTSDSGVVEVYLDGVNQTLKDNKFTIENIASGTHVIEVASPETSEFKYNSTSEIINVIKKDSEVSIELPQTIVIGEDVEIKVTSTSDGDIAVFVDGVQQKLADGKIIVKATAGNHTVIASVAENDKYKASGANSSFRVDKLDAQIAVSGVDITEGQNTTITIDTELNEGIVVVKINGTEVAVDLAKAKSVNIRLDAAGTYELSASYMGSEIYNPAEALKSTINVDKKETPKVNVTVPEIKANESEPISISIPNATGEVHVIIDGVEEVIPLDENGNATYTVPKMSAGSHSIVVVYPGDETHDAVIKSMPFEVTKQTSQANITSPSDVKEGENATVKVEIPDATGEVAIIIDGVEHKAALVNGTVEYPLDNLSSGNHSVVVIYPGDEAHDAVYNASSFNVAGKPVIVPIESKFSDITIGENLTISVILKDENGNAIKYAPIIYTINGVANTVNTTSDGSFVIQGENGTMLIVYEGNETFMGTNTTLTLNNTVPPAPVIVRVETKFNFTSVLMIKGYVVDAKAGEKGFEFITVLSDINGNPLANKTVQLAVNSKVYNQVTNESGKVHYYFNMVRAGRYTMTYIFLGDDTCNSTLSSACVDLEKKPITIQASSKTYKVSATKKYTITLKTIVGSSLDGKAHLRAGKKVILTLNGIKYTGKTDANGKVTFNNLKLTKRANYIAKITVEEDNTYLSATKKVTLKVR